MSSGPGCSGKGFPCPNGAGPNGCAVREIHISADIVVTARRHWWQTRNDSWLREVGQPLAASVADFYCSRATPSVAGYGKLSIAGVMGPDEHDDNVTDSTYTNAAAIAAIEFAIEASEELELPVAPLWRKTAQALTIPYDSGLKIHVSANCL